MINKKNITAFGAALLLLLTLSGCGGVTGAEYDKLRAERDALQARVEQLEDALSEREPETLRVTLRGDFTATVRHVIPDYVSDNSTPRAVVATQFQDGPFVLYVGDLAPQLEEGKTYVFEIVPQEDLEVTREEYEQGVFSAEEAVVQYRLRVSGFRAAQEEDYGLECSHFVFEMQEK